MAQRHRRSSHQSRLLHLRRVCCQWTRPPGLHHYEGLNSTIARKPPSVPAEPSRGRGSLHRTSAKRLTGGKAQTLFPPSRHRSRSRSRDDRPVRLARLGAQAGSDCGEGHSPRRPREGQRRRAGQLPIFRRGARSAQACARPHGKFIGPADPVKTRFPGRFGWVSLPIRQPLNRPVRGRVALTLSGFVALSCFVVSEGGLEPPSPFED